MGNREFWQAVYIAAIASGADNDEALTIANNALETLGKCWFSDD